MDGLAAKSKFALFSSTGEGAVIRNFTVSGKVTSTQPFAAVAVEVNGPTTIENVQVSADINASGYPLSGFVVYNKSQLSMKDCTFSGDNVSGNDGGRCSGCRMLFGCKFSRLV